MSPVKYEVIKITQNFVRLLLTGAPVLYIIISLESATFNQPLWLTIILGALLGGIVFIPSKEIGDSIWKIITHYVERAVDKPSPGDADYDRKIKEYNEWADKHRNTTFRQTTRRLFVPALKASSMLILPLAGLIAFVFILAYWLDEGFNPEYIVYVVLGNLFAGVLLSIILAVLIVILITLLFKLYLNEYRTPE